METPGNLLTNILYNLISFLPVFWSWSTPHATNHDLIIDSSLPCQLIYIEVIVNYCTFSCHFQCPSGIGSQKSMVYIWSNLGLFFLLASVMFGNPWTRVINMMVIYYFTVSYPPKDWIIISGNSVEPFIGHCTSSLVSRKITLRPEI